jgi:hypothetical protein
LPSAAGLVVGTITNMAVTAASAAIVAEVDELEDAPDEGTIVGKVTFTDVLIT